MNKESLKRANGHKCPGRFWGQIGEHYMLVFNILSPNTIQDGELPVLLYHSILSLSQEDHNIPKQVLVKHK